MAAVLIAGALVATLMLRSSPPPALRPGVVLVADAAFPSAMAPLRDGGLLYGERLTGRIRRVAADGRVESGAVAQVEVSTEGQRGLLGLARDEDGTLFAAWTNPRGRLVVGTPTLGEDPLVWRGPQSSDLGNGGRIAFLPDGRLLIGVGDLRRQDLIDDPAAPNGKLLILDPGGPPGQEPQVLAGGWNNPFAFAVAGDGTVWVADNEPGEEPERLARVSQDGVVDVLAHLPSGTAPSGLALTADGIYVCGYKSRQLLLYERDSESLSGPVTITDGCAVGVSELEDGRVAYAREDAILVVGPSTG